MFPQPIRSNKNIMKKIYLRGINKNRYALVDTQDFDFLSQWSWYLDTGGYPLGYKYKKKKKMHRLVMKEPKGLEVDHINGNKLDNRRSNLRLATRQQNSWNTSKNLKGGSSIYKGVTFHKPNGSWRARITFNGKIRPLGLYKNERHAALAYDLWANDIHKEFAKLNLKRI